MGRCFKCPIHGVAAGVVTLMVLVAAAAPLAAAQPQTRVSPSTVGTGFAEPRFTSYEYDFGAEHGFGASARVPKPIVSAEIVENLKEEADAGSRDSQYFYGLLLYYGEGISQNRRAGAKYFRKAAMQGHKEAATNLGVMHYSGEGSQQDDQLAFSWFRRAAEAGGADAQWMLGRMYYDGRGTDDVNFFEAKKWFVKSAEQGSAIGAFYVGMLCEYGLGGRQDFAQAIQMYTQAASGDNPRAMYHLGLMYLHGRGSEVDYKRAAIWFDMATRHQHGPAAFWLGLMHMNGEGFPVDYNVAVTFFQLARDSGDPLVVDQAADAVRKLTAALAEAERRNTAVRNKYDPSHPDFDPDFTKGRPYKQQAGPHSNRDPSERVSDPFLYKRTQQQQQKAERKRSREAAAVAAAEAVAAAMEEGDATEGTSRSAHSRGNTAANVQFTSGGRRRRGALASHNDEL